MRAWPLSLLAFLFFQTLPAHAQPAPKTKTVLVEFEHSAFPYRGDIPEKDIPFLDATEGDRRGHSSPRGGVYWEDTTYSDRRVLLSIPRRFDPKKPAFVVIYFHGNLAKLERDVRDRQQVPRQLAESGLNAVLLAPQLAVDARDSSAGRFWEPGFFARFLDEAADQLAKLHGKEETRAVFGRAPVLLIAYSGGYLPAIWSIHAGGATERVRGMIFLDALVGESEKVAAWLATKPAAFLVSAYTKGAREENELLQKLLTEQSIAFGTFPSAKINDRSIVFIPNGEDIVHKDFVTKAWTDNPLKALLARVAAFSSPLAPPKKPKR